jgi:hypothetical protein
LTQTGLLISFDKYQVAPGSEGIVKILVPFKDLSEFLLPQMKELFQLILYGKSLTMLINRCHQRKNLTKIFPCR